MAFIGNGAQLTDLDAGDIASGTLAVARGGTGLTSPGTSGNVLTSNGTSWVSSSPSGPESNNKQVFTSSGTFTVPAGVSRVKVTVIGAGGNGANGVVCSNGGGGGGAGGYVLDYVAVTAGGSATVTVGTSAGTRTSSFAGTTTLTASGGSNGSNSGGTGKAGYSAVASVFGITYGIPGSNRYNDASYWFNQNGNYIWISGELPSNTTDGSVYGHGYGIAGSTRSFNSGNTNRHIPIGYGAGGGGGRADGAYVTGGAGANGVVIVEW